MLEKRADRCYCRHVKLIKSPKNLLHGLLFLLLGVYFIYAGLRMVGFVRVIFLLIAVVDFAIAYSSLRHLWKK